MKDFSQFKSDFIYYMIVFYDVMLSTIYTWNAVNLNDEN